MALFTQNQYDLLLRNGANPDRDHAPVVPLFMADTTVQWLLSELDPDEPDLAFGLCDLGMGYPELGYVSLSEIAAVSDHFGLPIASKPDFEGRYPMSVYARAARIAGAITYDAHLLGLAVDDSSSVRRGPNKPQP